MIDEHSIQTILSQVDLVELIGSVVALRQHGRDYFGLCPFHAEKSPSFSVSPSKQFYYCFGCKEGGSAVQFLMKHRHYSFQEAIVHLAEQVGFVLPTDMTQAPKGLSLAQGYETLTQAARWYRHALKQHAPAIEYIKSRKISASTCQRFSIGYAPALPLQHVAHFKNNHAELVQTGLMTAKGKNRFSDRLMFPIRDRRGRVIAFGGRILHNGEPKYLNSPDSDFFHKHQHWYGWYEMTQANEKIDRIIVVEGYWDVLALHEHGCTEAVAIMGTGLSKIQVAQLFRGSKNIIFCFDGDRAGQQAAVRTLPIVLELLSDDVACQFVKLPSGLDPDAFLAEQGRAAFEDYLQTKSVDILTFVMQSLQEQSDPFDPKEKTIFLKQAQDLLNCLKEGHHKQLLTERIAQMTQITPEHKKQLSAPPVQAQKANHTALALTPVQKAIQFILQNPPIAQVEPVPETWLTHANPGLNLLACIWQKAAQTSSVSTATLLTSMQGSRFYSSLLSLAQQSILLPEEAHLAEFRAIVESLKKNERAQQLSHLQKKSAAGLELMTASEKKTLQQLLKELQNE